MTNASSFAPTLFSGLFAVTASALILGFAAGPAEARSVEVKVQAHELATPAGRASVNARIAHAAEKACGYRADERSLKARYASKACVADAIDSASPQVAALKASAQLAAR